MTTQKTYTKDVSFLKVFQSRLGWKVAVIQFFMNVVLVALFSFAIFVSQGELISSNARYETKNTVSELLQRLRFAELSAETDSATWERISRVMADSIPAHLFFRDNHILYSHRAGMALPAEASKEAARARLLREQAGTEYVLQPDFSENKFRFYIPLDEFGLQGQTALLERSFDSLLSMLERFFLVILFTALAITLLHVSLALLLHKIIIRPIGNLTRAAQRISEGDYTQTVRDDFQDEIGILGKTFNGMAEKIREQIDDLHGKNEELQTANKRIHDMAVTDKLTGLYNRHHLQNALPVTLQTAFRYERPLSLLLLDVDHFKKVNDTYGHLVGDLVLKHVAATLKKTVRQSDLVSRYGGEEMVLVLPETDSRGALATAEKIRVILANTPINIGDNRTIRISVSIGIAELLALSAAGGEIPDTEALISAADQALYQAKENGRNRVVVHESAKSGG